MFCHHKWNYHGKEFQKGHQYRSCEKCGTTQTLYHLLHQGLEWYFYEKQEPGLSYEQIKEKEKLISYISYLFIGFLAILLIIVNIFDIHVSVFFYPFFIVSLIIIFNMNWNTFKLYSVPVNTEKEIEQFQPKKEERMRESQIKSEKILMFKLANNEITKEEFTARMARL